jgi:predicted component of type VI protein secretion system
MLTLAPCPHCATRVPDDGAFCDSCGRPLAACPTCNELGKPGEKCVKHGVAMESRPSAAGGAAPPAAGRVAPTVAPPPRRVNPGAAAPAGNPSAPPASPAGLQHGGVGTTVQVLARKLRLVVTSGEPLAPFEVDSDTIIGRLEGPFAMQLDPFFNKGLSRRHCQFRRGPTGIWTITDLAGHGSTWVSADGSFTAPPLAPNASQPVEPGRDHVRLGQLSFRVEAIQ